MRKFVNSTIINAFTQAVEEGKNKQFMFFPSSAERYTYAQADAETKRLAKGYLALGVKKGDTVALLAPNSSDWCLSFLALVRIGATVVSVNTNFKARELAYVIKDSGAVLLVTAPCSAHMDYMELVKKMLPGVENSVPGQLQNPQFAALRGVVCTADVTDAGIVTRSDLIKRGEGVEDELLYQAQAKVQPEDYCNMQYTSGTTGDPKGVKGTHFAAVNNALDVSRQLQLQQQDVICSALPLFHCFAFISVFCAAIVTRASLLLPAAFDAEKLLQNMQDEKATYLCAVPTMLIALLGHPGLGGYQLALDRVFVGGALCPESVIKGAQQNLGVRNVYHGYGLTEGTCCVTMTHPSHSGLNL
ncbi:MAG: AMP-binding protein [Oscillospiraceae bacterium]